MKDLPAPVVYVCQANQFNYTKARNHGYRTFTYFTEGIMINSSKISWNSKDGNMTYKELENLLLDYDYSTTGWETNPVITNGKLERAFLIPHGVCMKLVDVEPMPWIGIWATNKVKILFVDPALANDIRTEETLVAQATIGPSSISNFELGVYEMKYTMYVDTIHDGSTCTDYSKSEVNYGHCLKNALKQDLQSGYGCIPPWVAQSNSYQVCDKGIKVSKEAIRKHSIIKNLKELLGNREPDMFKKCLQPCTKMEIVLKKNKFKKNLVNNAYFNAKSNKWATVQTQVYSYNIFSLTVDLGSALGLWMGLSCLSILDYILANWFSMKKYWKN